QIRTSNEQEKEALVREKYAEIKSLEAQINPHFLYNTLDAINWVAIDRKEYSISKMLTSLALILRYSIHKSNEIVEIRDELEYL
ncbi:histidine kinase, partial [Enterococcus faecalis]